MNPSWKSVGIQSSRPGRQWKTCSSALHGHPWELQARLNMYSMSRSTVYSMRKVTKIRQSSSPDDMKQHVGILPLDILKCPSKGVLPSKWPSQPDWSLLFARPWDDLDVMMWHKNTKYIRIHSNILRDTVPKIQHNMIQQSGAILVFTTGRHTFSILLCSTSLSHTQLIPVHDLDTGPHCRLESKLEGDGKLRHTMNLGEITACIWDYLSVSLCGN